MTSCKVHCHTTGQRFQQITAAYGLLRSGKSQASWDGTSHRPSEEEEPHHTPYEPPDSRWHSSPPDFPTLYVLGLLGANLAPFYIYLNPVFRTPDGNLPPAKWFSMCAYILYIRFPLTCIHVSICALHVFLNAYVNYTNITTRNVCVCVPFFASPFFLPK